MPATGETAAAGDESDADDGSGGSGSASSGGASAGGTTGVDGTTGLVETGTTGATTGAEAFCGDGKVDPGEQCDNGLIANSDDAICLVFCTLAVCGDGYVYTGKEECDDGNGDPLDGCHACGRTRKVFVTSQRYKGGVFMGLAGADQRCRSLAAQAGLANFAGFKAWLSDSNISARNRMYAGRGRYELVNGLLVAENWAALLAGELKVPIDVTETSETVDDPVIWTGTNPDGSIAEGADHCADWTSHQFGNTAFMGAATEISADWTRVDAPWNPQDCGGDSGLYCFEQK